MRERPRPKITEKPKRCAPFVGTCSGRGWFYDPEDSGSGRWCYCDCVAGKELREQDQKRDDHV